MNRLINQSKIDEAVRSLTQRYLQVIGAWLPVCPFKIAGTSNDATRDSWINIINQQPYAGAYSEAGKDPTAPPTILAPDAVND